MTANCSLFWWSSDCRSKLRMFLAILPFVVACKNGPATKTSDHETVAASTYLRLAEEVRQETLRSWKAYKQYAWGHDVLMRNSKA